MSNLRPTLIFDGECGICRTWVDYWAQLTGDRVAYPPLPGGGDRFSADPASGVQARDAARPPRWERLRRRRGDLPPADLCTGAELVVVALSLSAGFRSAERGGVLVSLAAARSARKRHARPLGSHTRAGVLRARLLAVPARARRHLCRRLRLARRADPRPRRPRRHLAARPLPRPPRTAPGRPSPTGACRRCSGSTRATPCSSPVPGSARRSVHS